ncbi:MAG: Rieske 2Fe-2S domain-containing protein [Isosphaeraceae bacterium]|nr:Rieske 2Fe-2S domain-containing protein [Isosphaeraceae bacterium]
MNRRDLYRFGTLALGGLVTLALAVPGVAYLFDPILRKKKGQEQDYEELTTVSRLKVGVPEVFPIIEERLDAWVKYPREPVGSVWLVRQPPGTKPEVLAFSAECPHLGCAVNLSADRQSFFCPCHTSNFHFDGTRINTIPPRGMDKLDVRLSNDTDPKVAVRFQRFRVQSTESIPLV